MNVIVDDPSTVARDRSPWFAILIAAALVAIIAAIGLRAWHDHIRGSEYSTVAEITQRSKIMDACFADNPNSVSGVIQCENDNGLSAPSYPWPTTHVWLSAALVFLAALVIGRLIVFMHRVESR